MTIMFCTQIKPIKRTQKPHRCIYCERIIPVGSRAYTWFYSWGGSDSGSGYSCHPCENSKIVDKQDYQDGDEVSGAITDYLDGHEYEKIKCHNCESHNYDEWEWSENHHDIIFTCGNCEEKYTFEYGF